MPSLLLRNVPIQILARIACLSPSITKSASFAVLVLVRLRDSLCFFVFLFYLTSCQQGERQASKDAVIQKFTEADAELVVDEFLKSKGAARRMETALIPQSKDYRLAFEGAAATKAWAAYLQLFRRGAPQIRPQGGETEVLIWSATTEELRRGEGDSLAFPLGYRRIAPYFQRGLRWYAFRFVRPGNQEGSSFDGLVYLGDHWALFPQPWRLLKHSRKRP